MRGLLAALWIYFNKSCSLVAIVLHASCVGTIFGRLFPSVLGRKIPKKKKSFLVTRCSTKAQILQDAEYRAALSLSATFRDHESIFRGFYTESVWFMMCSIWMETEIATRFRVVSHETLSATFYSLCNSSVDANFVVCEFPVDSRIGCLLDVYIFICCSYCTVYTLLPTLTILNYDTQEWNRKDTKDNLLELYSASIRCPLVRIRKRLLLCLMRYHSIDFIEYIWRWSEEHLSR